MRNNSSKTRKNCGPSRLSLQSWKSQLVGSAATRYFARPRRDLLIGCTGDSAVMMIRRNDSRPDDDGGEIGNRDRGFTTSEVLRLSSTPVVAQKPEEKISVFWRVFGGTLLSITALVMIQAYQAVSGHVHELRVELNRMREQNADFIKKDDFGTRTSSLWNKVQELQSINTTLSVVGKKVGSLEQQLVLMERERKEMQASIAGLAATKDRTEEIKRATDADHKELLNVGLCLNAMREKDAILERLMREGELERKELIREVQALRERIAKLEGTKSASDTKKAAD
jgi:hypothetical protein